MRAVIAFLVAGLAISGNALSHRRLRKEVDVREALEDLLDSIEQPPMLVLQHIGDQLDDTLPIRPYGTPTMNTDRSAQYKRDKKKLKNKQQRRGRAHAPGSPIDPQPIPKPPPKPSPRPTPTPTPKPHPKPHPKPDDEYPTAQVVVAMVAATLVVAALLYWLALIAYGAYRSRGRTYMQVRSEDLSPPVQRAKPRMDKIKDGISSAMEKGKEKVEEGANKVAHTLKPPGGKPVTHTSPTIDPKE